MSSLIKAAKVLVSISTTSKGGSPGFTPYHVFEALKHLSREPLGRIALSTLLGIGESSSRTLIERLEGLGFVRRSHRGVFLTDEGFKLLELLESGIRMYNVDLREIGWPDALLISISGFKPPEDLVGVFRVRDYIVSEGCREAIIGGYTSGTLVYPGIPDYIWKVIASKIPVDVMGLEALHIIIRSKRVPEAYNGVIRMLSESV